MDPESCLSMSGLVLGNGSLNCEPLVSLKAESPVGMAADVLQSQLFTFRAVPSWLQESLCRGRTLRFHLFGEGDVV